jgi:DNA-binding NtrC family response regulator
LKTVAVLDDDQALIELYQTILEEDGYRVHPVAISRQLSQILTGISAVNPDVLILDIHIPGLSSFDILKNIEGYHELANLKVLVCSASRPSLTNLLELLVKANLTVPQILEKPFDLDELSQLVDRLVLDKG